MIKLRLGLFLSLACLSLSGWAADLARQNAWLKGLKAAQQDRAQLREYFSKKVPPKGLVVIHAWDASPLMQFLH